MPRTLSELDPTEFENFAFDLLQSAGLQNVVWRTPGADGGRDIQGIYIESDFSGAVTQQLWYAECKHYSTSIDWPTVFSKIAYADNHAADYLLLITNSNPSPTCETEISSWNASRRRPVIRVWRGYDVERILKQHPPVAVKYGLLDFAGGPDVEFLPVMTEVMKIAQASYSSEALGLSSLAGLEACAAMAELVSVRMAQVKAHGRILGPIESGAPPTYGWLDWSGDVAGWDDAGLRAILSLLRYLWGAAEMSAQASGAGLVLTPAGARTVLSAASLDTLRHVALWADVEVGGHQSNPPSLTISRRVIEE